MKIFLTGATGMIGSALCLALRRQGHELCAWVRSLDAARGDQTYMVDRVHYTVPFGPIGRIAHRLFVARSQT